MLDTPPQDKLHKYLQISNACEHSCIMMIVVGREMYTTEYDLKAMVYPAYDTPHNIWMDKIRYQRNVCSRAFIEGIWNWNRVKLQRKNI